MYTHIYTPYIHSEKTRRLPRDPAIVSTPEWDGKDAPVPTDDSPLDPDFLTAA